MRWFCLSLLIGVLSLAAIVSASWPSAAQDKQLTSFELGLLAEHNNVRQKNNLKPLVWDDALAATAQEWAKKIAADGVEPPAHREGSPYGENISSGRVGSLVPRGVLAKWESSQVISSTTTRVGCGKARSADGQTDFLVCNYNSPSVTRVMSGMGGLAYSNGKSAKLATPTPSPVARQITSGATPTATPNVNSFALHPELHQPSGTTNLSRLDSTPTPTSNTNTECEELRKSEQQLTARVKQLGKLVDYFAIDWKLGDAERAKEVAKKNEERARTNAARKGCPYKYGIEFMKIPAGRFMMGGTGDDEKPVHEVTIRSFCMGEYEVTQTQWQAVMGSNPSSFKDCGGDCPVENVSWNDAQNFINKLNASNDGFSYRLPTEAEWEYAGRAGTTGDHAGNLNEIAWYSENSGDRTHAVGGKQPNAWGLYDMIGNVQEWCEDWDHKNYDGAPTDGSAWVAPTVRQDRVQRGGSFAHTAGRLRSANRDRNTPADRHRLHGLRVVAYR